MQVKIKKLIPSAVIPTYAKQGDAGMDLTATSKVYDKNGAVSYGTGISVAIPKGYVGLIFPRSSVVSTDLSLVNSVGVIDSGYRGEILVKFKPSLFYASDVEESIETEDFEHISVPFEYPYHDDETGEVEEGYTPDEYKIGDRVAQLIILPYPEIEFTEVDDLDKTDRGNKGFGSSGK